jgi:carbon monoxide dehydrogenase subunit G
MFHVQVSEHIDAPIDHVWELIASCERLPEWNVVVVEIKDCPDRLDRVGATATAVGRILGRKIETTQETTRADKPHTYALKLSGAGGAKGTGTYTFSEARGGTDATLEVEGDLPMGMFAGVAEKLLGGTLERDARHSMENFKALCEATVPAHV